MRRAWRFQLTLFLVALLAAITELVAEYAYDASSAVTAFLLTGILATAGIFSLVRLGRPLPRPARIFLKGVAVLCLLGFVGVSLLGLHQSAVARAFTLAHIMLILMACKFCQIERMQDYTQILIMSLFLMVVAAITCGSIIVAPFFVIYMFLMVYCLIFYQLQRQVEMVCASRFIGARPGETDRQAARLETRAYWKQLGLGRFQVTCGLILVLTLLISALVFVTFPRLEAGTLLGTTFGTSSVSGFSDQIRLGSVNKNQTLRQVVVRASFTQNGQSIASENRPFYLRCISLDTYRESENLEGIFTWRRSNFNYFSERYLDDSTVSDDLGVIKSEILLNPIQNNYLPGIYPILNVEGLPSERLRVSRLDRAVKRWEYEPDQTISYTTGSAAHITPERSYRWFKRNLAFLGANWQTYGKSVMGISDSTSRLAHRIVEDRIDQRILLQEEQDAVFRKWWTYRSRMPHSFRGFGRWYMPVNPTEADPNDEVYQELVGELYQTSLALGQIDRELAEMIERYLEGHYSYSTQPPRMSLSEDDDASYLDPIEMFLSEEGGSGRCEYFASSMVQLCRSLGMRVRLGAGYLAHEYQPEFDYHIVRQRDAHCWVEVYTADRDWEIFDPTPPAPLTSLSRGIFSGLFGRLSAYFEQRQFNWLKFSATAQSHRLLDWANQVSQWVERLDPPPTPTFYDKPTRSMFKLWFSHHPEEPYIYLFFRWMIFFLLIINVGIGGRELLTWLIPAYLRRRRHRQTLRAYSESSVEFYRQMLEILRPLHIYKSPNLTTREFAWRLESHSRDFEPVGYLGELYNQVRFGNVEMEAAQAEAVERALAQLRVLVLSVRKTLHRPWPWEQEP